MKLTGENRNLSQCHFVHHKYHMDGPGIEPDRLSHGTARCVTRYFVALCITAQSVPPVAKHAIYLAAVRI
jgi:hypothetical protein